MTEHTYQEYLQLRKGGAPPRDPHEAAVRVYVDTGGALRTVQSDGTDAAVGGGGCGGSLPAEWTVGADGNLEIAPTDNTDNDLLVITEPPGYADNSGTGNVLRVTDGVTDILYVDAYGDFHITAPADNGNPSFRLASTDNPGFQVVFDNNGLNVQNATGTVLIHASASEFITNTTQVGFFGSPSAPQPVVPLTTPSVQNVIDALVALGLVSQSD